MQQNDHIRRTAIPWWPFLVNDGVAKVYGVWDRPHYASTLFIRDFMLSDVFEPIRRVTDGEGHVAIHTWPNEIRGTYVTPDDLYRRLFDTIDKCPRVTFWLPTRYPHRVRDCLTPISRKVVPDDELGIPTADPYRRANLRLGLIGDMSAHHPDALTDLERLCGGAFVLTSGGRIFTR